MAMLSLFIWNKGTLLLSTSPGATLTRPDTCHAFERKLLRAWLAPRTGSDVDMAGSAASSKWYAASCRPLTTGIWHLRNLTQLQITSLPNLEAQMNLNRSTSREVVAVATRCHAANRRNGTSMGETHAGVSTTVGVLRRALDPRRAVYRGCKTTWHNCKVTRGKQVARVRLGSGRLAALLGAPMRCTAYLKCANGLSHSMQKHAFKVRGQSRLVRQGWRLSGQPCQGCPHPAYGVRDGFACIRLCEKTHGCTGWVYNSEQKCYLKSAPLVWERESWSNGTTWAGMKPHATGADSESGEPHFLCRWVTLQRGQRLANGPICFGSLVVDETTHSDRMRSMLSEHTMISEQQMLEKPTKRQRARVDEHQSVEWTI